MKEILQHGFLEKTLTLDKNPADVAFREFCSVWGVGPKKAQLWVNRGFRSLQDVRNCEESMSELTMRERTGLKHAEDFQIRIPRQVFTKCLFLRSLVYVLDVCCARFLILFIVCTLAGLEYLE